MNDIPEHWFIPDVEALTDRKLRRIVKLATTEHCLIHLFHACFESPLILDVESVRFLFELLHLLHGLSDFLEISQLYCLLLLLQEVLFVNSYAVEQENDASV